MKKSWYKKWWVWVVAVALILVIVAVANGNDNNDGGGDGTSASEFATSEALPTAKSSTQNSEEITTQKPIAVASPTATTYSAGMYKIGQDIPAGEYLLFSTGYGYYEVSSDATGVLESIITNDNFDTFTILTVSEGNYLTLNHSEMCLLDDYFANVPSDMTTQSLGYNQDGTYGPGMYKIGLMLPAGEYELTSMGGLAYMAVLSDSLHIGVDSIVSNDNFETNRYITVKDGQYLLVNNATISPNE